MQELDNRAFLQLCKNWKVHLAAYEQSQDCDDVEHAVQVTISSNLRILS